MTTYPIGANITLTVQWYEFAGGPPADVSAQTITIIRISDSVVVLGPTAVGISHPAVGLYAFTWTVPGTSLPGDYAVVWNATDAQLDLVQTSELITLQSSSASSTPCAWAIDTTCCSDWETLSPAVQAAATEYATAVLWAATGRRFGLCPVVVRPCGRYTHGGTPSVWGYTFSLYGPGGAAWYPYIGDDGQWRNCACPATGCGCRPDCEVYLPAPVASVTEVIVDGAVVDPSAYRVDDNKWLVRTDGGCWPDRADLSVDSGVGFFQVAYVRGETVPPALLGAAGILACEYAKACVGGACRLPASVQSIARQGVNVQFLDFSMLVDRGMTGITEVDTIIQVYNPFALKARLRVWSPEVRRPRMTTSP